VGAGVPGEAIGADLVSGAAMKYNCILWTQYQHFKDLENVRYSEKEKKAKKARRNIPI
jgi:hypothetical protein